MNDHIKTAAEISSILKSRFELAADVQVIHPKEESRTLYSLEHIPLNRRMTMAGLERRCRRSAKALDAELYGMVNIDFVSTGEGVTFDMMAEYGLGKVAVEDTGFAVRMNVYRKQATGGEATNPTWGW